MNTWFSADLHLGHANIINYCNRPFYHIDHMNAELIRRWNERVKPEDLVFHVGDFCFKSNTNRGEGINVKPITWEEQLNGKIIFLRGNHDKNNSVKTKIHSLVINIDGHYINLVHDPIKADANYKINLCGHIHEKWQIKRIKKGFSFTDCINIGVDVWDFRPISYEEIKSRYTKWLKENE